MSGGKGSVVKSAFAVLMLTTLFNGFGCLGVGYEFQIASSGLILAAIVTFESFSDYRSDLKRGQRSKLLMQISNVSAEIRKIIKEENKMEDARKFWR